MCKFLCECVFSFLGYIPTSGIAGSFHTVLRLVGFDLVQRQGNGLNDLRVPFSRRRQC